MIEIKRYTNFPVEMLQVQRDANGQRKIRGLASVYYDGTPGSEYQLGENLYERIARGAWTSRLGDDVAARVNHDSKLTVGRTPKTLALWETSRGLEYEITLPNTSKANDLWEEVQGEIIRGSSFHALIDPNDETAVEYRREGDKRVMIIKRFSALVDVAPVNQPAYQSTDCTAMLRSFENWEDRQKTEERLHRWQAMSAKLGG